MLILILKQKIKKNKKEWVLFLSTHIQQIDKPWCLRSAPEYNGIFVACQSSIFDFNLIDCKQLANCKQLGMHLVALNGLMYIPLHEIHE